MNFINRLAIAAVLLAHLQVIASPIEQKLELLSEPIEISSNGGVLELDLSFSESVFHAPCHDIITRQYSFSGVPSSPGPTLRIKPGDFVSLTIHNTLSPDTSEGVMNHFRLPRTTNLHTHGLHISPLQPGDNILKTIIKGGESYQYLYQIPEYHAEGLYWYHPHQHGSGALQDGGGAIGAIIIDNDAKGLPEDIALIPKSLIILSHWNFSEMDMIASASGDTIWKYTPNGYCPPEETASTTNFFTTNGQSQPWLNIKEGQWHRLQVLNTSLMSWINILPPEGCEFQLLAKDGIYLQELPRHVSHIILPGAGRADLAVRCSDSGQKTIISAKSTGKGQDLMWEGVLFHLLVQESQLPPQPPLTRTTYDLPCYLHDLTHLEPEHKYSFVQNDNDLPGTYTINGISFNPNKPIYKTHLGVLEEWTLGNIDQHSFHIHVTPFQLMTGGEAGDNYLQKGDWHDTIYVPDIPKDLNHTAVIRLRPDAFFGDYVMHCHIMPHQDQGMMAFVTVGDSTRKPQHCPSNFLMNLAPKKNAVRK